MPEFDTEAILGLSLVVVYLIGLFARPRQAGERI
jgi:hypothetical protein